jgi:hypothetical protein
MTIRREFARLPRWRRKNYINLSLGLSSTNCDEKTKKDAGVSPAGCIECQLFERFINTQPQRFGMKKSVEEKNFKEIWIEAALSLCTTIIVLLLVRYFADITLAWDSWVIVFLLILVYLRLVVLKYET